MLRPATPLSVLFGVAFVLLLLSTLSTPVVKSIPLASYNGSSYGVFGYCTPDVCYGPSLGYVAESPAANSGLSFTLPTDTRHSLSSILVVHPVACFMTLVCFVMAVAAHFHAPSHSSRYLLTLLILSFPTLLVTLLAFLVDILLFIPHMGWGGWIVLVATIIIMACALLTCAMRRTIVSRKDRERRLEENKDMNGENFYAQQFAQRQEYQQQEMQRLAREQQEEQMLARAESPPPLSRTAFNPKMNGTNQPSSATYEYDRSRPSTNDDRAPLDPRDRSTGRQNSNGEYSNGRPYGNEGYMRDDMDDSMRRDPSASRSGQRTPRRSGDSQRSGGPPPFYGARGRGGYPPRGGPRGMFPPGPHGYPPRGGFRGGPRGPPPSGWHGNGLMMAGAGAGAGMAAGAMMGRGRGRGPPPGYDRRYYGPPPDRDPYGQDQAPYDDMDAYGRRPLGGRPSAPGYEQYDMPTDDPAAYGYGRRTSSPGRVSESGMPRGLSPPPSLPPVTSDTAPIGMAVEMDANHGSLAHDMPDARNGYNPSQGQAHELSPLPRETTNPVGASDGTAAPVSPWAHDAPAELGDRSPPMQHSSIVPASDGVHADSTEPLHARTTPTATATRSRASSDHYYEDVDPRFAETQNEPPIPPTLIPGYGQRAAFAAPQPHEPYTQHGEQPHNDALDVQDAYAEDPPSRTRSLQESETSDYTSISQRGINPNWRPAPGEPGYDGGGSRTQGHSWRAPPATAGVLDENPDFAVPGVGPSRGARVRGMSASATGAGQGPYPGAI